MGHPEHSQRTRRHGRLECQGQGSLWSTLCVVVLVMLVVPSKAGADGADARLLFHEGWEDGISDWNQTGSRVEQGCGPEAVEGRCTLRLWPRMVGDELSATRTVDLSLDGVVTLSFEFRPGGYPRTSVRSHALLEFTDGTMFRMKLAGGGSGVGLDTGAAADTFWGWSYGYAWYRYELTIDLDEDLAQARVFDRWDRLLGASRVLDVPPGAAVVEALAFDSAYEPGGENLIMDFDDYTVLRGSPSGLGTTRAVDAGGTVETPETEILALDAAPAEETNHYYHVEARVLGESLPRLDVYTLGWIVDEAHIGPVVAPGTSTPTPVAARVSTWASDVPHTCVLRIGPDCAVLAPGVAPNDPLWLASAESNENRLIVEVVVTAPDGTEVTRHRSQWWYPGVLAPVVPP